MEPPPNWCYVFNFEVPHKPRALRFPTGKAAGFGAGMKRLVDDLRSAVPAAFEAIFEGAFTPAAGLGGAIGVMVTGFQRAACSYCLAASSRWKSSFGITESMAAQ